MIKFACPNLYLQNPPKSRGMVIKELIPLPSVLPFYNIFIREKVPVMFFVSRVDVKFPYLFFFYECVLLFSFQVLPPILDKEHECVCVRGW